MNTEKQVIDYLKAIPERRKLADRLGTDPDHICCYYLCPLSNLESIIQRGIECHNAAPARVDFSSCEVQQRRRSIWLGRSTLNPRVRRGVQTHSCVNFFWNPLNHTFAAFQRNAVLRRYSPAGSADEQICLLEVDAEALLEDGRTYWGATARNIASGSRTYFELADLQSPDRFEWAKIFESGPLADREAARHRAAEFVVFTGAGPNSKPVPWSSVRRIILPTNRTLGPEAERIVATGKVTIAPADVYKSARELLKAEGWFIAFLDDFRREIDAAVAAKIEVTFRSLIAFEERAGRLHRDPYRFRTDSQAYGVHGIGHVARVMFWARFLLCYEDAPVPSASDSCLLASLLHDLCRLSDREDEMHGRVAAEQFAAHIRDVLGSAGEASVASAINAITMHCRDDADCAAEQQDPVWRILKDADALERGRFAPPNRPGGCSQTYLRTPLLRQRDQKNRVGSVAFHLAAISKYALWSRSPCADLFATFYSGLRAAVREGIFESLPSRRILASALLEKLSPLDEVVYYRRLDDLGLDDQEGGEENDPDSERDEDLLDDELDDEDFNDWDDHDCEVDD